MARSARSQPQRSATLGSCYYGESASREFSEEYTEKAEATIIVGSKAFHNLVHLHRVSDEAFPQQVVFLIPSQEILHFLPGFFSLGACRHDMTILMASM